MKGIAPAPFPDFHPPLHLHPLFFKKYAKYQVSIHIRNPHSHPYLTLPPPSMSATPSKSPIPPISPTPSILPIPNSIHIIESTASPRNPLKNPPRVWNHQITLKNNPSSKHFRNLKITKSLTNVCYVALSYLQC